MESAVTQSTIPPQPHRWLVYPVGDRKAEERPDVVVDGGDRFRACAEGAHKLGLAPEEVDALPLWAS